MQKRRGILNQVSTEEERELFAELFSWSKENYTADQDFEELTPVQYGANLDINGEALRRVRSLLQQISTEDNHYVLKSTRAVSFDALTSNTKAVLKRGIPIRYSVSGKQLVVVLIRLSRQDGRQTRIGFIHSLYIIEALLNDVDSVQLPMATVKVPSVFVRYKDFHTRVLDLVQVEWSAIPLNWCQYNLLGAASLFPDPRNKNRVFVLDRDT